MLTLDLDHTILATDSSLFLLRDKIDLVIPLEVPGKGPSKSPLGRSTYVGHFHDDMAPEIFLGIIFEWTLGMLHIPSKFVEWFGPIPGKTTVLINTGCSWNMISKFHGKRAIIDQGWASFAAAHKLKVGHFLTFQKDAPGVSEVVIFDYTRTKVMTRCPDHGVATRLVVADEEV
jgi:hypothetical protein